MTIKVPSLAAVLLGTAVMVATAAHAQDIKLGFNGDLAASPSAQSGQAGVLGIEAAIEDINAAGGVLGQNLTLVVRDDLSQPPKSIQNMSDLIDNEGVVAVFGPTNSGNALAWKHMPNQKQIPTLGCIGSATDITKAAGSDDGNYMYRVSMVDRGQIAGLVTYAKTNPASKKVGIMIESTGYGQGGLKDLEELAEAKGLEIAAIEKFGVNDTDMTSQLNKMKGAGVDTVLVWAQGTPIAQLLRSMEKIDYFPVVLSSWAADNASFFDTAGPALSEKPVFMRTITEERTPKQQALFERLEPKLTSKSAFSFAAHCYDAVLITAAAINQAGTTDGPAVKEALENLRAPVEGVMKTYQAPFTASQHEALTAADYRWTHWVDGKLVPYSDDVVTGLTAEDFAE